MKNRVRSHERTLSESDGKGAIRILLAQEVNAGSATVSRARDIDEATRAEGVPPTLSA
jgi:hypothetical protein